MSCPSSAQARSPLCRNTSLSAILPTERIEGMMPLLRVGACPMPKMRSICRSAAVAPDFASMRRQRDAGSPRIRELQAMRGVTRTDPDEDARADTHQQILEAYGYRQMTEALSGLSLLALERFCMLFGLMPDIRLGPRGCAAANTASVRRSDLDQLIQRMSADVEHWISPAAKQATDTRGLLLVFGEDHYDPAVHKLSARLMREFKPDRGDRFFMEGAEDWICAEREPGYRVPAGSCRLLEKDSPIEMEFNRRQAVLDQRTNACLAYLHAQVPGAVEPPPVDDAIAVESYIKHWRSLLPADARPGFIALQKLHRQTYREFSHWFDEAMPKRDQIMADALGRDLGPGWNFAIVGARHLPGLRQRLAALPCVFMLPKLIAKREPGLSLRASARDEL